MKMALWVFAALLLVAPVASAADAAYPGRTVSVSGEAEIKRAPDKAVISIGIQEQKRSLKEAQKLTDEQLKSLYRIADELGIEKKDLRTEYSSVQPVYNYDNGKQVFTGYSVNHQVSVTLRDIEKLADFTQKALDAKIDQINNVQFGLQKEEEAKAEALVLAMENAHKKAELLAKAENETLGRVYTISESGARFDPPPMPMMRGKAMMVAEAAPAMDVSAPPSGEITVSVGVQAMFLLKE